jgi:hypothetical protein
LKGTPKTPTAIGRQPLKNQCPVMIPADRFRNVFSRHQTKQAFNYPPLRVLPVCILT